MSEGSPLVSVCIPCYNAEKTIAKTLDSILRQSYSNVEIIVSDNQSNDATREVVLGYEKQGVRLVLNPPVKDGDGRIFGPFDNWDHALSQGKGDFLCLYHADDLYEPEIIEKEVRFLINHPKSGAVVTQWKLIDENDCVIQLKKNSQPINFKQDKEFEFSELFELLLRHRHFIDSPTLMIRKEVASEMGSFNAKRFAMAADLDYFIRISMKFKLGFVNEKLHFFRLSETHVTATTERMRTSIADYFIVMEHYINLSRDEKTPTTNLDTHNVYLSTDMIRCSFYLMWLGEQHEALAMVKQGLHWRNLRTIQGWKVCLPGILVYVALVTGGGGIVRRFLNWRFGKR